MVDASSSVKTQRELTREAFDRLLGWLDQDRDRAADKYEEIRIRLIKVFETRGCENCEDLTDDTIDRVARRVHEISGTYEGNPALYFHGVARLVYLEYLRKRPKPVPAAWADAGQEIEQRYNCLEDCLNRLSPGNRELILNYYEDESQIAGDPRKEIAARLGISPNAVRIRAHRIRESLSRCVRNCLTLNDGSMKASKSSDMVVQSAGPVSSAGAYQSSSSTQVYAVTLKVTNTLRAPEKFGWQYANPTLADTSGKDLSWSRDLIETASGKSAGPELQPGQAYLLQYVFSAERGRTLKEFTLALTAGRTIVVDLRIP